MTPAQAARLGMRIGDELLVVADEMGRPDPCQPIITSHAESAAEMLDALDGETAGPDGFPLPVDGASMLRSDEGVPRDVLQRWGEAWRTWGERLRVEAAREHGARVGLDVALSLAGSRIVGRP